MPSNPAITELADVLSPGEGCQLVVALWRRELTAATAVLRLACDTLNARRRAGLDAETLVIVGEARRGAVGPGPDGVPSAVQVACGLLGQVASLTRGEFPTWEACGR